MTIPQFLIACLVLIAPPLYWIWWLYSKSHPEGRWRRLFGVTAMIGVGIVLFSGWLYVLDRLSPSGGILTRQAPVIIGLFPVVIALAVVLTGIIIARLQHR